MLSSRAIVLTACISLASLHESQGFSQVTAGNLALKGLRRPSSSISRFSQRTFGKALALRAQEAGPLDNDTTATAVGAGGLVFSLIMLYSEYTLKTTGCGVPAGPAGLYGAAEGISYLYVLGLVGYSLYTKVKTGKGLPAGPNGLLGAAEGMGFLAVLAGVIVLGFQIADYGFIPNAVPSEGSKCQ